MTENTFAPSRTFHKYRAEVLEAAVVMEQLMDDVISSGYGQSSSVAQELQAEILGRASISHRIAILKRMLADRDLTESYPFVTPVLSKLFEVRNDMAHSLSGGYDPDSDTITLLSMNKGKQNRKQYTVPYLEWVLYVQAHPVQQELRYLFWAIAPMTEEWHES
jgi:hypothetical protein